MRHPGFYFLLLMAVTLSGVTSAQSWQLLGPGGAVSGSGGGFWPAIATDSSGAPWVAYRDLDIGSKINVKKFNGSSWTNILGPSPNFIGDRPSIAITNNDTVYVAYRSGSDSHKVVIVLKYNGASWTVLGTPVPYSGTIGPGSICIVADDNGHIFFAFANQLWGVSAANIVRFDGNDWVQVGSGSTWASSRRIELAMDNAGTLYVGYDTPPNPLVSYIVKLVGNTWDTIGKVPVISAMPRHVTDSTLYVACQDSIAINSVRRFTGKTMTTFNSPGVPSSAEISSVVTAKDGYPYIGYAFSHNGFPRAFVKKYDGNNWLQVGAPGFSATSAHAVRLVIGKGVPYIVYTPTGAPYNVYAMYYDNALGVADVAVEGNGLKAYPNPSKDKITIELPEQAKRDAVLTMTDMSGKTVMTQRMGSLQKTVVDIKGFAAGVYYLHLSGKDEVVKVVVVE